MSDDRFAFEKFAPRAMTFRISRRQFWSLLWTRYSVARAATYGGDALSLEALCQWPDEQLAQLMPGILPGCQITLQDGFVCGQMPGGSLLRLFPHDSPALTTFNLMNGYTTLAEIAAELTRVLAWDEAHSFAYTRGLFLSLVLAGVCAPRNMP
ncbi:MAG: hypothetical protein HXY40_08540 [Chloroflexi bacterium]|nr:hypothetical protein [Chloroflexota bacterium]